MKRTYQNRKGSVLLLVVICLTLFLIMLAFSVDFGRLYLAKAELQNAVDSAAMAGANVFGQGQSSSRDAIQQYSQLNKALNIPITIDRNDANSSDGGIVFGQISNPFSFGSTFTPTTTNPNAIRVTAKMATGYNNGPIAMFFGTFAGTSSVAVSARSTVSVVNAPIIGFDSPEDGSSIPGDVIPFTFSTANWDAYFTSLDTDVNIYPLVNSPGNFGLVNLTDDNVAKNSDLERQITSGLTAAEREKVTLTDHGVSPDHDYYVDIKGEPGLRATLNASLQSIIGSVRTILIHRSVTGQGNNTIYRVVRFESVKVIDAQLTGGNKRLVLQSVRKQLTAKAKIRADMPSSAASKTIFIGFITK